MSDFPFRISRHGAEIIDATSLAFHCSGCGGKRATIRRFLAVINDGNAVSAELECGHEVEIDVCLRAISKA